MRWSEARRSGVEGYLRGGGAFRRPLERRAASGSTRGEGKNWAPGQQCEVCERDGELRQDPGPTGAGCDR
jgi:hypothetical protein